MVEIIEAFGHLNREAQGTLVMLCIGAGYLIYVLADLIVNRNKNV